MRQFEELVNHFIHISSSKANGQRSHTMCHGQVWPSALWGMTNKADKKADVDSRCPVSLW